MSISQRLIKPVSYAVLLAFAALTLHVPAAHAGLVGTETAVKYAQTQGVRDNLRTALEREDVKQALMARGVSPEHVQARVDALTDDEAQQLAAKMDEMPAGGDALGLAVFVFLVLLLTDILGFTDIFPFVKKPAK